MDDLLEGLEDIAGTGAIDARALSLLKKPGSLLPVGSLIANPRAAASFIRKASASKVAGVRTQAALMRSLMTHEAIHQAESRKRPTVLVNVFFSAVGAAGTSAVATIQRPYSGRNWAISMIETFCTVNPDPFLLIQFDPGGVDLAVSPSQQAVSYSAGAPQNGIPSATFGTLNTARTDPRVLFAPWTGRSMVFTPTDTFKIQAYNAGAAAQSLFVLLKVISSPCSGDGYKMQPVPPSYWSRVQRQLHARR